MTTTKELILSDMRRMTLHGSPIATASQLAKLLRRPTPSVRRCLGEMASTGFIAREGQGYVLPGKTQPATPHEGTREANTLPQPSISEPPMPVYPMSDGVLADVEDDDEDMTILDDDDEEHN